MARGLRTARRVRAFGLIVMGLLAAFEAAGASGAPARDRIFEWTFDSKKAYVDPFNDVDVDVVFNRDGQSWRVPAFWRGGNRWTVRFAPPVGGRFTYHLESTDRDNRDLNGRDGQVTISAYTGSNALLRHGSFRVSANKRYLEHVDGTPFYWLGDTWWTGLSDRLSWQGFQQLAADRRKKGFTVVQLVAGLVPPEEEAPLDAGFRNEGGPVWEADFKRINPRFFDFADRRIQLLVDSGMTPAIVGGWNEVIARMDVTRMKKHWRYLIARYSAYPVFWVIGGEVYDPPEAIARVLPGGTFPKVMRGWTDVARYVRASDPMHHLITVHEVPPPYDIPLQDASLTDFELAQASHFGWFSIGTEIAQLNLRYARSAVTKPVVMGEIGYENLGGMHLEDFQRAAFWLAMLNGAAGHTYGANGTWESYGAEKPLHRQKWSFMTWDEGMALRGASQVALGARLLRRYPWERMVPHPEWVHPRGTTLLQPRETIEALDVDLLRPVLAPGAIPSSFSEADLPAGEWQKRKGRFRAPYASGIPRELRIIYMPYFGLLPPAPPTVLGLEPGVRYRVYYWEPSLGIKFDLGIVQRAEPGAVIGRSAGVRATNAVASVDARSNADATLILRYQDADHYLAAVYSAKDECIFLLEHEKEGDGPKLAVTSVTSLGPRIRLTAEVRGNLAVVSITDGRKSQTSEIVQVRNVGAGEVRLHSSGEGTQVFENFEVRESVAAPPIKSTDRKLYDMAGRYRGELSGDGLPGAPGWSAYGREQHVLLDAYLPERLPASGDWLLVLERAH